MKATMRARALKLINDGEDQTCRGDTRMVPHPAEFQR